MDPLLTNDDDRTPATAKETNTQHPKSQPADSLPDQAPGDQDVPQASWAPSLEQPKWVPSSEEVNHALAEHKLWLDSGEKDNLGQKASFINADLVECALLEGQSLQRAVFDNADLSGAKLGGAQLQGAKLRGANLRGATLSGAKLNGANLHKTTLTDANLQDADLTNVKGLLSSQLARANLSGATLPEAVAKFDALQNVSERSQIAKRLFATLLLGCIYALLTVATTTDIRLLTNSASSPLPVIQTQVPIAGFYFAAPVVLLGLSAYFLLYLQRLWESLAKLPAVFPDGTPLDEKAYPWLPNSIVHSHFPLLKQSRPPFSKLQALITIILGYWVVPITLIFVWGRYLPRHDRVGTGIHAALLVIAIGGALVLQRLAAKTLQGKKRVPVTWKTAFRDRRTYKVLFCSLALVAVWGTLSYGAIEGHHPHPTFGFSTQRYSEAIRDLSPVSPTVWVPQLFHVLRYAPYLDLSKEDVSTKPPNWTGQPEKVKEEMALVTGAQLRRADLRYAVAQSAFLGKADLINANLQEADLSGANLQGAHFLMANLQGADFRPFDDQEPTELEPDQVKWALNWELAYYDDDFLPKLGLPPDHNDTLPQKLEELADTAKAAGNE